MAQEAALVAVLGEAVVVMRVMRRPVECASGAVLGAALTDLSGFAAPPDARDCAPAPFVEYVAWLLLLLALKRGDSTHSTKVLREAGGEHEKRVVKVGL